MVPKFDTLSTKISLHLHNSQITPAKPPRRLQICQYILQFCMTSPDLTEADVLSSLSKKEVKDLQLYIFKSHNAKRDTIERNQRHQNLICATFKHFYA